MTLPDNTCNRHTDCKAADLKAKLRYEENLKKPRKEQVDFLTGYADHCHDDCCEDCFGY